MLERLTNVEQLTDGAVVEIVFKGNMDSGFDLAAHYSQFVTL